MLIEKEDANGLYRAAISELLERGNTTNPRGMETNELLGVQLRLTNPRNNIVAIPARKLNYQFLVGECLWMLCGFNQVDLIEPYNRNIVMAQDGECRWFQGAYGPRILDQMGYILDVLREDPDSRQAVLTIWRDRPRLTKDIPCTVSMQFFIRDDALHMHTYMRSNDVWLGLPYDLFNFTFIQMFVAQMLGRDIGEYVHTVGSFHLYERNYEKARALIESDAADDVEAPTPEFTAGDPGLTGEVIGAFTTITTLYRDLDPNVIEKMCNRVRDPWRGMLLCLAQRHYQNEFRHHEPWLSLRGVGR